MNACSRLSRSSSLRRSTCSYERAAAVIGNDSICAPLFRLIKEQRRDFLLVVIFVLALNAVSHSLCGYEDHLPCIWQKCWNNQTKQLIWTPALSIAAGLPGKWINTNQESAFRVSASTTLVNDWLKASDDLLPPAMIRPRYDIFSKQQFHFRCLWVWQAGRILNTSMSSAIESVWRVASGSCKLSSFDTRCDTCIEEHSRKR